MFFAETPSFVHLAYANTSSRKNEDINVPPRPLRGRTQYTGEKNQTPPSVTGVMGAPRWKNIYELSPEQIEKLEQAENKMESMEITESESILLGLLEGDGNCIPVLNILGHLYGRYLSDFESSIQYYDRVLDLEPDNAWARDERRRYRRYLSYD